MHTDQFILNRKGIIFAITGDYKTSVVQAASFQAELMNLGYMLNKEAFDALATCHIDEIERLHGTYIPWIAASIGAGRNYQPLYKGFPQEVIEKDCYNLFLDAIIHYWSCGTWAPESRIIKTYKFEKHEEFKELTLISYQERAEVLGSVASNILASTQALPDNDRKLFLQIWEELSPSQKAETVQSNIPFKENLMMIISKVKEAYEINTNLFECTPKFGKVVKTVTDIIRFATYESGGMDARIEDGIDFIKLNRPNRRFYLALLDSFNGKDLNHIVGEMQIYRSRWLRFGERLHPGDYAKAFPFAFAAFDKLRNGKVPSWAGQVNARLESGRIELACNMLSQKPGEFARRLDHLLREWPKDSDAICSKFAEVAHKVSVPVLCQVFSHFKKRSKGDEIVRTVVNINKGDKVIKKLLEKEVKPISADVCGKIILACAEGMCKQFEGLDPWHVVDMDPNLDNIPVPFDMRDIQQGMKSIIRGSRFPLGDKDTVRAYVHWFDEFGRIDLDLSMRILDKDNKFVEHINFGNPRSDVFGRQAIVHSGDVRNRVGACAEYVDINIPALLDKGAKYAVFDVRNFNHGNLNEVEGAVFGFMMRDEPEHNNSFVPDTIKEATPITSYRKASVLFGIDLETREYVWLDIPENRRVVSAGSVDMLKMIEYLEATKNRMSLYNLFAIHAKARMIDVDTTKPIIKKDFTLDMAYKYDEIQAEYMGG